MKIVVTGSTGQLGRALQKVLPEAVYLSRSDLDLMSHSQDIRRFVADLAPDVFINCAGFTAVDDAEQEIAKAYQVNATAVGAIAQGCIDAGSHLFHISSDYVFDVKSMQDHAEDEKPNPSSVYGMSKYAGETYLRTLGNSTIIRTSWLFGEGKNFVTAVLKASEKQRELPVVYDQLGRPTSAHDLAVAIGTLVEMEDKTTLPQILHIQNEGMVVSRAWFAYDILRMSGKDTLIHRITSNEYSHNHIPYAQRPMWSVFNLTRMKSLAIGMPDWRSSLKEYIASITT